MMTLSTSTWLASNIPGTNQHYPFEKTIRDLKEAGFDYLDANLWLYSERGRVFAGEDWEEQAHRMRECADQAGIAFRQTHGQTLTGKEWDDPSYPDHEFVWEMNRRCIKITKILGADWMVMHPSNLPHDPLYSRKKAMEENIAYLAPFLEDAKKVGIGIAVENMVDFGSHRRRYCGGDPEELIELVDCFRDPALGMCIDTGHAHISGIDVGSFIRMAGNRLKCTHIDDNLRDRDAHLPPFMGSVNWKDTVQALKEIGYTGDFSFEVGSFSVAEGARATWYRFMHSLGEDLLKL